MTFNLPFGDLSWNSCLFLLAEGEALQYAAFFGLLFILGGLEVLIPRCTGEAVRRRRWPSNFGLTALNILALGALPVSGLAVATWAEAEGWGLLNRWTLPLVVSIAAGVLIRTFVSDLIHVAMHRLPWLWRVHRVHHTDTALDVSSTVRFHPLEFAVALPPVLVAIAIFGISPAALVLYEILDAGMAVWTHANLRLPRRIDSALRWFLVTPDMHRIHHSAIQRETDSNYGVIFPWWDRLCGTYRAEPAGGHARMTLGLTECQDERSSRIVWLLGLPFRRRIESRTADTDRSAAALRVA
jgi:sterol desaturase/sphingolipid hydroxylase (fatty acid hydroxylase superfamily)